MEAGGVLLIKRLHLREQKNALVKMFYAAVPDACAALFHRTCNQIDVNDVNKYCLCRQKSVIC